MQLCLLTVQTVFWYAGQWMRPEYGADKRRLYSESNGFWLGGMRTSCELGQVQSLLPELQHFPPRGRHRVLAVE